jgi:hypothetical protein
MVSHIHRKNRFQTFFSAVKQKVSFYTPRININFHVNEKYCRWNKMKIKKSSCLSMCLLLTHSAYIEYYYTSASAPFIDVINIKSSNWKCKRQKACAEMSFPGEDVGKVGRHMVCVHVRTRRIYERPPSKIIKISTLRD